MSLWERVRWACLVVPIVTASSLVGLIIGGVHEARAGDDDLEAMGWHDWWGRIDLADGGSLSFYMADVRITESEHPTPPIEDGGALLYACLTRWEGPDGRRHQCEVEKTHTLHRCECGTTRKDGNTDCPGERVSGLPALTAADAGDRTRSPSVGGAP